MLFVSLIFLLILTLIGITAARMQTVEERMAQNDDNHQLAVQAAEAALRYGETLLWGGIYSTPNFAANAHGLYQLQSEVQAAVGSSSPAQARIREVCPSAPTRNLYLTGSPLSVIGEPVRAATLSSRRIARRLRRRDPPARGEARCVSRQAHA